MSLGHLSCSAGCKLLASDTPTAKDKPDQSAGASGKPNENVSACHAPHPRCHCANCRPSRPRPAVWRSATSKTGCRHAPARARRINSVLVESTCGQDLDA